MSGRIRPRWRVKITRPSTRYTEEHRDGEERLRRREEQLLALVRVDRQAVQTTRRDREHDRQGADQQGPLVHLRGHERPQGGVGVQAPGVQTRDQQLGSLGGRRPKPGEDV